MTEFSLDDLASPEYRAQLAQMHERGGWGVHGGSYAGEALALASKVGGTSILDYGCGGVDLEAAIRELAPNVRLTITGFDPGVPAKSALPEPADIVVCVDVLEHVEPSKIGAVLTHIYELTRKAAVVAIATRPAENRLPDGRNAHLLIDNAAWWYEQFERLGPWTISVRHSDGGEVRLWLRKPDGPALENGAVVGRMWPSKFPFQKIVHAATGKPLVEDGFVLEKRRGDFAFRDPHGDGTSRPMDVRTLEFVCPRTGEQCGPGLRIGYKVKPPGKATWAWNGNFRQPTLEPSIRCSGCGWHGYLKEGVWIAAE